MPDMWLNLIGLAISTGLIVFLVVRTVKSLVTGIFNRGGGIRIFRDQEPVRYLCYVCIQIVGAIFCIFLYGLLLYNKFFVDLGWIGG